MPVIEGTRKVGNSLGSGQVRIARADYDFAVSGGAISQITLPGDTIPSGAIIIDAYVNVATVPTSGGAATISVDTESAADMQSAAAISGAPWSTLGAKLGTKTATTAPVKTTASRAIKITVATATLTAGKFQVAVRYFELG